MAGPLRDRVTVDLRGIGDAVRAAARNRQVAIAVLARQALVGVLESPKNVAICESSSTPRRAAVAKLTLRMRDSDADLLAHNANALGLSYGAYVARLVRNKPPPLPAAERQADRAALLQHCDRLAQWAIDTHSLARLLRMGCFEPSYIDAATGRAMAADVRRHLDIASRLLAQTHPADVERP